VNTLTEELQCTLREMLKELESDKATGRYVVWLRFTRVLERKYSSKVKESLAEFFPGEFLCYNLLLMFWQFLQSIC